MIKHSPDSDSGIKEEQPEYKTYTDFSIDALSGLEEAIEWGTKAIYGHIAASGDERMRHLVIRISFDPSGSDGIKIKTRVQVKLPESETLSLPNSWAIKENGIFRVEIPKQEVLPFDRRDPATEKA